MYRFLPIGFCVLLHAAVSGQPIYSDSSIRAGAIHSLIRLYDQKFGEQSHVYNGSVYFNRFALATLKGHTFYGEDDWQDGYVFYDGQLYEDVSLRYDLFLDKVIIEHPAGQEIELITEKVDYFKIGNQVFDRLVLPSPGFYARIYSGDIKVYARHYKTIQEKPGTTTMITEFLTKRKLYIVRQGNYYAVHSRASALKVFAERKSDLKKFLNREGIVFAKDKEYALRRMAEYMERMSKQQ